MKNKLILTALAVLLAAATVTAAPAKMQVTLSITPDHTLPGLPVPLQIHVQNGAKALHIGPSVRVHVTSPSGESFFADWGEGLDNGELEFGLGEDEEGTLVVPANAAVDLAVPASDLSRPSWALDPRMIALPGVWTLQVHLFHDDESDPVAVSNAAKLTIDTPTGRDVPVWEALQRHELFAIADVVQAQQPESRYFPYLAAIVARRDTMEKIAIIDRAMKMQPDSPAVPSLRYALVSYYGSEADRVFFEEHDRDKAVALAERGRGELAAMTRAGDVWSRLKGKERLEEYPSAAYFDDLERLQREKGKRKQ